MKKVFLSGLMLCITIFADSAWAGSCARQSWCPKDGGLVGGIIGIGGIGCMEECPEGTELDGDFCKCKNGTTGQYSQTLMCIPKCNMNLPGCKNKKDNCAKQVSVELYCDSWL